MINFLKKFKTLVPSDIQYTIWIVLLAFFVFVNLSGSVTFLVILENALVSVLIVAGLWMIYAKKETLVAYVLLFFLGFADQLGAFVRALFSLNFSSGTFTLFPISWQTLIGMIGTVYLMLMIVSYLVEGVPRMKYQKSSALILFLLSFLYAYFRFGTTTALILVLPSAIALVYGAPVASALFLLSYFITVFFDFLNRIINGTLGTTNIGYWLFLIVAIAIIGFIVIYILDVLTKKKKQVTE